MLEIYAGSILILLLVGSVAYFLFFRKDVKNSNSLNLDSPRPNNKTLTNPTQQNKSAYAAANSINRQNAVSVQLTVPNVNKETNAIADLRRNLKQKLLGDEAKLERLVDFERKRNPTGNSVAWLNAAIKRLEDDNR